VGTDDKEVRITLRLSALLHSMLVEEAAENSRSLNGEISSRLTSSFRMLDLTDEGIVAALRNVTALTDGLFNMMMYYRDVDLDGFIADQSKEGNVMEKTEAVEYILREYLSERGYVVEPPDRRRGLEGL